MEGQPAQNIWDLEGRSLHKQKRRTQMVNSLLKNQETIFLLDVGCSEGYVTKSVSHFVSFVVGIDIDKPALKLAKSKVVEAEFICASLEYLPFKTNVFDAVFFLEVIEHLPTEIQHRAIDELDRVLQYDGVLIVSAPYKQKIIYTRCIHCGKHTPIYGHLHTLDEFKITNLLPPHYKVVRKKHITNLLMITYLKIFEYLPFRIWVIFNDLLGLIRRKGGWIVLKYLKVKQ